MKNQQLIKQYQEFGEKWVKGLEIIDWTLPNGKKIILLDKQVKFLNSQKRYCLYSGGFGCGKSLVLLMKMFFFCLFFPNNLILLGRKTLQDIQRTTLPDLFDIIPIGWYNYRVKDGTINFFNNSKIVLFGLDTLQEGGMEDIKKAQQKIKSLNLGAYFIDQLEEVEYSVFDALNARLRRTNVPLLQGNMTTNPANFWAYEFFKKNPHKESELIEGSMLDNKENLPESYIKDRLDRDERYVKKFVYGIWSTDVLTDKAVFAEEYIQRLEFLTKEPVAIEEGCQIWEQPISGQKYQMGVDPSEGAVDPSSISVVKIETGEKVAKYNGFIPISALIEKTKLLYYKYNKAFIIPEVNASGVALLEGIKDLNVYEREVPEYRTKTISKKLGWKTFHSTKQMLISHFQDLLRKNFVKIFDKETIEELKAFIWSDVAKQKGAGAQKNYHDDDVISTMLAYWGIKPKDVMVKKLEEELFEMRKKQKIVFQYF